MTDWTQNQNIDLTIGNTTSPIETKEELPFLDLFKERLSIYTEAFVSANSNLELEKASWNNVDVELLNVIFADTYLLKDELAGIIDSMAQNERQETLNYIMSKREDPKVTSAERRSLVNIRAYLLSLWIMPQKQWDSEITSA